MRTRWLGAMILCAAGLPAGQAERDMDWKPRRTVRPELAYGSYLGGGDGGVGGRAVDSANAVGTDAAGMLYVTGFTMALDFPVMNPIDQPVLYPNGYYYEDIFITKINPWSGGQVYSTIVGGPGTDIGYGMAVSREGAVYVAGRAGPEFPYTKMLGRGCESSNRTAFVLKLAPAGDRVEWAACLCAGAYATALALGGDGGVYAAGFYQGMVGADAGLPVTEGAFQAEMPPPYRGKAFVVKLTGEGELSYATWLAGNGEDMAAALAVTASGEAVVLGTTTSNTFPVVNALREQNASGGGVSWSGDGGRTWQPRNAGLEYNSFTQIVADPFTAGTAYAVSMALGIVKTADFGATWRAVNGGIPLTPTPNVLMVAASKAAPGWLYAMTTGQLLRSEDGGQNWNVVPLKAQPLGVWPDPASKDAVYVLVVLPPASGTGQPEFQLLRTGDAGASWLRMAANLTLSVSAKLVPDESRDGVLYLVNHGYFRSADRGETWTPLSTPPPLQGTLPAGMQGLALDQRQPGVLYADVFQPTPEGVVGGLARSADDGQSWALCGTFPEQALSFWVDAAASEVVYAVTRSGVYRSADRCATFEAGQDGLPGRYLVSAAQDAVAAENLYVTATPAPEVFVTRLSADGKSAAFSTYVGTREADYATAAAVDAEGGIWLAGYTTAEDWPVSSDAVLPLKALREDGFLTRLSGAGDAMTYSTYLGGNGSDAPMALAVDPGGELWVAGATRSTDFPLMGALQESYKGGQTDAFVLCLADGGRELAFSTYLGGTGNDWLAGLRLDTEGSVLAAGTTSSTGWPVSAQAFQPAHSGGTAEEAMVVKLSRWAQAGVTQGGPGRPGDEEERPPTGRPRRPVAKPLHD